MIRRFPTPKPDTWFHMFCEAIALLLFLGAIALLASVVLP